jgi:hypothetical protein
LRVCAALRSSIHANSRVCISLRSSTYASSRVCIVLRSFIHASSRVCIVLRSPIHANSRVCIVLRSSIHANSRVCISLRSSTYASSRVCIVLRSFIHASSRVCIVLRSSACLHLLFWSVLRFLFLTICKFVRFYVFFTYEKLCLLTVLRFWYEKIANPSHIKRDGGRCCTRPWQIGRFRPLATPP